MREGEDSVEADSSRTAAIRTLPRYVRSEELLHKTLSMLCNFVWTRQTRPGEHMWSIPVDAERDFDCILFDAIDELVTIRTSQADLLAALKAVVEVLQKEAPGTALNNHKYDAVGMQALAAIAKAEGR